MPDAYILDANVLFSARLRDLWLELSTRGVAHVRLTDLIDREWTAAVARARPEHAPAISRTARLIKAAFARDYIPETEIPAVDFGLPDSADEHVARAALAARATIVTMNLADFPKDVLDLHGLTAISSDAALLKLALSEPDRLLHAVRDIRNRLRKPPTTPAEHIDGFDAAGCPDFAAWLRQRLDQI